MGTEAVGETVKAGGEAIGLVRDFLAPWNERRLARVKADGVREMALAEVEATETIVRCQVRLAKEMLWEQRNLESIREKVLAELAPAALEDTNGKTKLEDDWYIRWSHYARNVSDSEVQNLWAKLLTGELTEPGRFSLQALHTLSMLRHADAERFAQMANYVWEDPLGNFFLIMTEKSQKYISVDQGMDLRFFAKFAQLGLLHPSALMRFEVDRDAVFLSYQGDQTFQIQCQQKRSIDIRLLTDVAAELLGLCPRVIDERYRQTLLQDLGWIGPIKGRIAPRTSRPRLIEEQRQSPPVWA